MHTIRKNLNGNFTEKVKKLDELTKVLVAKQTTLEQNNRPGIFSWQVIVKWLFFAFFFMIIGHAIFSFLPLVKVADGIKKIPQYIDLTSFLLMLLTGFFAQMVDGSLGMGYGTISTTFLTCYWCKSCNCKQPRAFGKSFFQRRFGLQSSSFWQHQ